jgi:GNAT superfamily N-acetyltransferase
MIIEQFDGLLLHHIESPEAGAVWRAEFSKTYCKVFEGEPYLEKFDEAQAAEIFDTLLAAPGNVTLILAHGHEVVGFGAAVPLIRRPDVAPHLTGLVPLKHTMYLAEMGVLAAYRGRRLGKRLVMARLQLIDQDNYTHVVLRVSEKRKASRVMYQALEFEDMGVDMVVHSLRIDGEQRSDLRTFMSRVLSQVTLDE